MYDEKVVFRYVGPSKERRFETASCLACFRDKAVAFYFIISFKSLCLSRLEFRNLHGEDLIFIINFRLITNEF